MVWGASGCAGCETLAGYVDMMQRASLWTEGCRLCGNDWVLQQDKAAAHNTILMKNFFQNNNTALLDHPACPSDLNPRENVWGWTTGDVHTNRRQFQTADVLDVYVMIMMSFMKPSSPHGASVPPAS